MMMNFAVIFKTQNGEKQRKKNHDEFDKYCGQNKDEFGKGCDNELSKDCEQNMDCDDEFGKHLQ